MARNPRTLAPLPASPEEAWERRAGRVRAALAQRIGSVVAVVEAVHRRHNTSAILRSCEAFGVHEVHLISNDFRPAKGAARGSERWVDLRVHATTASSLSDLKARGFAIYVADLGVDAFTPDDVPLDRPLAVVFGGEVAGISDQARALADGVITVPMRGLTESLNVASAATCALYRLAERRRALLSGAGDLDPAREQAFYDAWQAEEQAARAGMDARNALDEDPDDEA
jgi:tRNA (guanosine-2'-O-)-methyltransferase